MTADASGRRWSVLVVDDDAAVRHLVCLVLDGNGFSVREAEDGRAAWRILASHRDDIDVVFTDIVMPRLDGALLGRRVARRWPDLPVVYTSGFAQDQLRADRIAEASLDLLRKPFLPSELLERIERALGLGSSAA